MKHLFTTLRIPTSVPAVLLALLAGQFCNGQMHFRSYAAAEVDRFAASSSFVGDEVDFSGVGRASTGHWATLVGTDTFISANHYHAPIGTNVVFYENNNPNGGRVVRKIVSGQRLGTSDLWLGKLNAPVPPSIQYYKIPNAPTATVSDFVNAGWAYQEILTVGKSPGGDRAPASTTGSKTDFAVGRNAIDHYFANDTFGNTSAATFGWSYDFSSDANYLGGSESLVNSGDSGAPSFVKTTDNELLLLGIHFHTAVSSTLRDVSVDTYVPNYFSDVQASQPGTHVPEPSKTSMLGLSLLALTSSRRR